MFTSSDRARLRSEFLDRAAKDARITGAAITGSVAVDREDKWSDIDLAFGVADSVDLASVLSDWTSYMYADYAALTHFDVRTGAWIYRVFLLPSTLQVDLAFVPAAEFRPMGSSFRLVSGTANGPREFPIPQSGDLIGMGWLYALHVRSSIARGHFWQAEYMISAMRDTAMALACVRHGLPAVHGRGFDALPSESIARFQGSLVRMLEGEELSRAFRVVTEAFLGEVRFADVHLARRLEPALAEMCGG